MSFEPLVPVAMVIDAMEADPTLPTPLRRDAQMIRQGVEVELRLIDDLLDLSRIGSGKLNLRLSNVDLHDPLSAAISVCRADAEESGIDLRADLSARVSTIWGDSTRLQQVFWNLIRNAIKFTPAGGRVRVRSLNADNGNVLIEVRDDGIGIEPEKLSRIFDAFEQAGPDIAARFGGLGLGLAIAQGLTAAQAGTITASSEGTDRGAVFIVRFPTVVETPPQPNPGDSVLPLGRVRRSPCPGHSPRQGEFFSPSPAIMHSACCRRHLTANESGSIQ